MLADLYRFKHETDLCQAVLVTQWGWQPEHLGLLETGAGMDVDSAVSMALLGKSTLLDYARCTFSGAEQAVSELAPL